MKFDIQIVIRMVTFYFQLLTFLFYVYIFNILFFLLYSKLLSPKFINYNVYRLLFYIEIGYFSLIKKSYSKLKICIFFGLQK